MHFGGPQAHGDKPEACYSLTVAALKEQSYGRKGAVNPQPT